MLSVLALTCLALPRWWPGSRVKPEERCGRAAPYTLGVLWCEAGLGEHARRAIRVPERVVAAVHNALRAEQADEQAHRGVKSLTMSAYSLRMCTLGGSDSEP